MKQNIKKHNIDKGYNTILCVSYPKNGVYEYVRLDVNHVNMLSLHACLFCGCLCLGTRSNCDEMCHKCRKSVFNCKYCYTRGYKKNTNWEGMTG